jgi:hypothetical protein
MGKGLNRSVDQHGPILTLMEVSPIEGEPINDLEEPVWADSMLALETGQEDPNYQAVVGPAGQVMENLERLLTSTRVGEGSDNDPFPQREFSNLSTSSSSQACSEQPPNSKRSKGKKPPHRPPLLPAGGPKCLRFMEAVSMAGPATKKKGKAPEGVDAPSPKIVENHSELENQLEGLGAGEAAAQPGINNNSLPSGVNVIMCGEDADDIEGFNLRRELPNAKVSEAELIVQIQAELGLNFIDGVQNPVENVMMLEDRDRDELNNNVETNRSQ